MLFLNITALPTAIGFAGVDPDATVAKLNGELARLTRGGPLAPWAVLATPEGVAVVPRSALVGRLKIAALDDLARQAATVRLPRDQILAWVESETVSTLARIPVKPE